MYVCICQQVTDGDIREAVANDGACSMRDLHRQLGVASSCGCCAPCAREVLMAALQKREAMRGDDKILQSAPALQPG